MPSEREKEVRIKPSSSPVFVKDVGSTGKQSISSHSCDHFKGVFFFVRKKRVVTGTTNAQGRLRLPGGRTGLFGVRAGNGRAIGLIYVSGRTPPALK